jgi:hypothetical protein
VVPDPTDRFRSPHRTRPRRASRVHALAGVSPEPAPVGQDRPTRLLPVEAVGQRVQRRRRRRVCTRSATRTAPQSLREHV